MAISARSRRPTSVVTSMLSRSLRASSGVSTGVLPRLTACLGPRTECAGLIASTWPTTSQSNSMRTAARCCLTVGFSKSRRPNVGGDVHRLDCDQLMEASVLAPGEEASAGVEVGRSLVRVLDRDGEEFEIPARRLVAGRGDKASRCLSLLFTI